MMPSYTAGWKFFFPVSCLGLDMADHNMPQLEAGASESMDGSEISSTSVQVKNLAKLEYLIPLFYTSLKETLCIVFFPKCPTH